MLGIALLSLPSGALANDHAMKLREVFAGTLGNPNAEFVELQMRANGQIDVNNNQIKVYSTTGTEIATHQFNSNVANGANQSSILVGTPNATTFFGVTPDLSIPAGTMNHKGGQVCYIDVDPAPADFVDCASWGAYTGSGVAPFLSGTPFNSPQGIIDGRSMLRDISGGTSPTLLDAADDTNDSAADFDHAIPAIPRNNAGVSTTTTGSVAIDGSTMGFTPAPGVNNRVDVSLTGSQYTVRDNQAPIDAGAGCTQQRTNTVRCPVISVGQIEVDLADGKDRVIIQNGVNATARGGDGDDQLISRNGDSLLDGGANNDTFDPGTGADDMIGGSGQGDTATYAPRGAGEGVSVSLDGVANDGNPADNNGADNVRADVERITGGAGADEIIGSNAINLLIGGGGQDILSALGGSDIVRINGDGVADNADCGVGASDHVFADVIDTHANCELTN